MIRKTAFLGMIVLFLTLPILQVAAQQGPPEGVPPAQGPPESVPPVTPPEEPRHPYCWTPFVICSPDEGFPGAACWLKDGSVWGGPVTCEHDTLGEIDCNITWPNCYLTG